MSDDEIYEIFHLVIEYGREWDEPSKSGYRRKAKTKSQKPKVKKVRVDYLSEEELNDLTKDYASEEEFKIKKGDIDNVDEEVARWTREKLMRQFENNKFKDLTKDSFFDNVDAEEDYHSNHTSQDGDDVPTMYHIEDHEGFADKRDFVMAFSNLYEKEDHDDEEPFLPPQALESMFTIGMEWPNISECRSFMRNFVITQRFTFRHKKNESKRIRYVAKEIENLIRDASTTKPMQISDIVYRRFGVRDSYYTAWNTRNMVMEKIVGSYDKGYVLCPELYVEIQKSNPGSIATCSREDGNLKFTDMCISFKAALDGFSKGCKPILGLDGCFLKGKYGGQCLSIISLNTNNGLFPIAVFICRIKVIDQLKYEWVGYCSHYHRVAAYVPSYDQAINPIADSSEWGEYIFTLMKRPTREIRPPPLLRPAGRPRTLRRRDADEVNGVVRQPRRCSKCQAFGHNNRTCKDQPAEKPSMGRGGAKAYRLDTEFRTPSTRGRGRGGAEEPSQPPQPSTPISTQLSHQS
ncbi:hypothetical protein GIB67_032824 [Kingdonia uniflora]|uniref:Transposase n=1 Tax=Kingdonia uniflora TaxID=39325 RepID=A0A7J7NBQ8_9MAGN|nr:hypothetical protein GIB67_032824 [Kingdonia uniflora]